MPARSAAAPCSARHPHPFDPTTLLLPAPRRTDGGTPNTTTKRPAPDARTRTYAPTLAFAQATAWQTRTQPPRSHERRASGTASRPLLAPLTTACHRLVGQATVEGECRTTQLSSRAARKDNMTRKARMAAGLLQRLVRPLRPSEPRHRNNGHQLQTPPDNAPMTPLDSLRAATASEHERHRKRGPLPSCHTPQQRFNHGHADASAPPHTLAQPTTRPAAKQLSRHNAGLAGPRRRCLD